MGDGMGMDMDMSAAAHTAGDPLARVVWAAVRRERLLPDGGGLVVGLSGGPDSVCLLHILAGGLIAKSLGTQAPDPQSPDAAPPHAAPPHAAPLVASSAAQAPPRLLAVHVNHMLRGAEAERDMVYARQLCAALGVPLVCERADVAAFAAREKISEELAGREVRYRIFERERAAIEAGTGRPWRIAVAHNRDDLAETVLINLTRGAGPDGLSGMGVSTGACVVRPLLDVPRSEIEAYNARQGLAPVSDSSNTDRVYTRNRVRLDLLPLLRREFNPNITQVLARLARIAGRDRDYMQSEARRAFCACLTGGADDGVISGGKNETIAGCGRGCGDGGAAVALSLPRLLALHDAIAARVVRLAAAAASQRGDARDLSEAHTAKALSLARTGAAGRVLHLPGGLRAQKSYQALLFYRAAPAAGSTPESAAAARLPRQPDRTSPPAEPVPPPAGPVPTGAAAPPGFVTKSFHKKDREIIEQIRNIRYNSFEQFFDADTLRSAELVLR
ncbi:MAG: tRNA lysidine(34) synthetase TilS, partial [Clostridiales bacterium]|nr:tRNA lysidine(34) synthetase TilS [Clostridiales bacterium]